MFNTYTYSGTTWVQLANPDADQLAEVAKKYDISPEIISDIADPSPRQKIEIFDDEMYVVLHIPAYKHSHAKGHNQEVDFVIGKDFVVTVQYDTVDALQKLSKEVEARSMVGKDDKDVTPGVVFVEVLNALYTSLGDEINFIQDQLQDIENEIFAGKERQMVTELSRVGRDILDIRRTLAPQKAIFENLMLVASKSKNTRFTKHTRSVYEGKYQRTYERIQNSAELLAELRETNNSLVSTNQNEVMKVLTIMAFITFPLTLVTGVFGMNTIGTPIIGQEGDFWTIVSFMALATIVMFFFFKWKKWL